jgi:hypothetical protein
MPLQPVVSRGRPTRTVATARANASVPVVAPVGGLNFRDAFMTMSPSDATVLTNVIARANGLELRGGWVEYATNVTSGSDSKVRTIMVYHATTSGGDRIFAAVGTKVYNVTSGGTSPPVAFTSSNADGYWSAVQFSNSSGTFLCAGSQGGYWTYDPSAGWVDRTANLTGRPSDKITGIYAWKKRLWFTFDANTRAYYLPLEAIQGTLTAFDFGPQMQHGGGEIAAMATFTQDGGLNINDYLVVFGREGDVIIYEGYDPSNAANFQLVGAWYVGRFPRGTEFCTKVGSDLYALSENGIVPMSLLVGGRWTEDVLNNPVTGKIQNALGPVVVSTRGLLTERWQVTTLPSLGVLLLKEPVGQSGVQRQWIMNLTTGAWSTFEGVPILHMNMLRGRPVFGTADGRVCFGLTNDEDTDGELLDGTAGSPIDGEIQGAFYDFGQPGLLKHFQLARTIFNATDAPSVAIRMNTEFSFASVASSPQYVTPLGAQWDQGLWDQALWAGSANTYEAWSGLSGIGYYGALRVRLRSIPGTLYTGAIVNLQAGGPI